MGFDLNNAKSIFQSTTFWGAVVSLFAMFAPHIFTNIVGTSSQATVVSEIVAGIGFIVTVIGRFTAKQVVTLTGGPTSGGGISKGAMKGSAG